ncbi:DUF480 domain-containing protein [Planctomicrobium sp. SH661]|uniref:DUF480 domain-containing protein n=1 Tax=Planctomicrobium sp. SH661 TaxID=3448124 RepID=UPI003F5C9659
MSDFDTDHDSAADLPPVRHLSKPQRRVLGTLVEKAFTVPESYPMTLKGLTTGCNQKSNRDPMTNYTEDAALDALDELRKLGLVAVVHTESGRTERYRHYTRKRFPFTEPQLAIMTELLLRGRQQMGELRARASRMVPIESLDDLRKEIEGLISQNYVQANGSLDRRGVEVDHCFYLPGENVRMSSMPASDSSSDASLTATAPPSRAPSQQVAVSDEWKGELESLRNDNLELKSELQELKAQLEDLKDNLANLRQSLGA